MNPMKTKLYTLTTFILLLGLVLASCSTEEVKFVISMKPTDWLIQLPPDSIQPGDVRYKKFTIYHRTGLGGPFVTLQGMKIVRGEEQTTNAPFKLDFTCKGNPNDDCKPIRFPITLEFLVPYEFYVKYTERTYEAKEAFYRIQLSAKEPLEEKWVGLFIYSPYHKHPEDMKQETITTDAGHTE